MHLSETWLFFYQQGVSKNLTLRLDRIDHTTALRVRSGENNKFQKLQ